LGVLSSPNPSTSVVSIVIPESAHHGDLRGPSPNDPVYLTNARMQEEAIIVQWLSEFYAKE
jgi:lysosomal Pro-X carboxypeptidase